MGQGAIFPNDSIYVSNRTQDGERSQANAVTHGTPPAPKDLFIAPHITGDYGHRNLGMESGTMHTPALPKDASWNKGYKEALASLGLIKRASSPLETMREKLKVPEVMDFLKENPNPPDSKLHSWAESKKIETDKVEAAAYQLATLMVEFLHNGKAYKAGIKESDVDPKELAMGIKVEMEHTDNIFIATRIALDHLTEIKDYYTRLAAMEKAAKKGE